MWRDYIQQDGKERFDYGMENEEVEEVGEEEREMVRCGREWEDGVAVECTYRICECISLS